MQKVPALLTYENTYESSAHVKRSCLPALPGREHYVELKISLATHCAGWVVLPLPLDHFRALVNRYERERDASSLALLRASGNGKKAPRQWDVRF